NVDESVTRDPWRIGVDRASTTTERDRPRMRECSGVHTRAAEIGPVSSWILTPFESLGPLRPGAPRDEVLAKLGEAPREFFKRASTISTEAYERTGLHAYFDHAGKLELIEAFAPCRAAYLGVELLERETKITLERLRQSGLEPRDDQEGGLWFDEHGFALYAPEQTTEGQTVFHRGYDTGT